MQLTNHQTSYKETHHEKSIMQLNRSTRKNSVCFVDYCTCLLLRQQQESGSVTGKNWFAANRTEKVHWWKSIRRNLSYTIWLFGLWCISTFVSGANTNIALRSSVCFAMPLVRCPSGQFTTISSPWLTSHQIRFRRMDLCNWCNERNIFSTHANRAGKNYSTNRKKIQASDVHRCSLERRQNDRRIIILGQRWLHEADWTSEMSALGIGSYSIVCPSLKYGRF